MEKIYRVAYWSMFEKKMGTYDLLAVDRADAIHLTLRKFPYLIVHSAEIVL